jgi:hypothetical protein
MDRRPLAGMRVQMDRRPLAGMRAGRLRSGNLSSEEANRAIHLAQQVVLRERLWPVGPAVPARWPGALRRIGAPDMDLRIDDQHRHTSAVPVPVSGSDEWVPAFAGTWIIPKQQTAPLDMDAIFCGRPK